MSPKSDAANLENTTKEQTELLFDLILEELKGMNDIEIVSAENHETKIPWIRYAGQIVIKYETEEEERARTFLRFFTRKYKVMVPKTSIFKIKNRLTENPKIGVGFPSTKYLDDTIYYNKPFGESMRDSVRVTTKSTPYLNS